MEPHSPAPSSARGRGRRTARPIRSLVAVAITLISLIYAYAGAAGARPVPGPLPTAEIPNFANSSLVDFSYLRSKAPHGFLKVGPQGTFVWRMRGGRRAGKVVRVRFWGVNVSNKSLWIPHAEIDRAVDALSRSGVNLVRFEALDSIGALLDIPGHPGSRTLNPEKFDTLCYWIYRIEQKHINYYFDLLDFRVFTPQDGADIVTNRGARPYAVFDPRLITLQEEYASELLTTENPYTHLRPVDDPHLALMEICDEHGFFINPQGLDRMVEPYRSRLQEMWNQWLVKQYQTRDALAAKWGSDLGPSEDPLKGTVAPPTLPDDTGGIRDPATMTPRLTDTVAFLYEVQRNYFHTMMTYLRSIGLRIPVTAVVSNDVAPDLASVASECNFLAENFYADHPRFSGKMWVGKYHFRNTNQLCDGSPGGFAPYTATLRWEHKPVVIREWGTVWPNRYRAGSLPEALAYASLQDYDGLLLFAYKTREYANYLTYFGFEADPTVWGLYGLGALAYLRHDISSASSHVEFAYTPRSLFTFPNGGSDADRLAWIMGLDREISDEPPALPVPTGAPKDLLADLADHLELDLPVFPRSLSDLLTSLGYSPTSVVQAVESGVYTSCTQQITLDTHAGRLLIGTPRTCAVAGNLQSSQPLVAGVLSVTSVSPVGTVMAVSLDGRPLGKSRHYIVKMVTVAENTGQDLVRVTPPGQVPPDWVLQKKGTAPIVTLGTPALMATTVSLDGRPIVTVQMKNGTWELIVNHDDVTFACDTPGVKASVLGRQFVTGPVERDD